MIVNTGNVARVIDRLREADSRGEESTLFGASFTIDAAMSVAIALGVDFSSLDPRPEFFELFSDPVFRQICDLLTSGSASDPSVIKTYSAPLREFFLIRAKDDLLADSFSLFCNRFGKTSSNGSKDPGYRSLKKAFIEMSDNIVEHAFAKGQLSAIGLVGYQTDGNRLTFSVCDSGRGLLASLKTNSRWERTLADDCDAVRAVGLNQATRRENEQSGGGFNQLFDALLGLNSFATIRSFGGLGTATNGRDGRKLDLVFDQIIEGTQVTVTFAKKGPPQEIVLDFIS